MKKLLLIDGNAILHRAYHAYPPLTNPQGDVINAVLGFFSMLLTVLADQKPDYLVVCFDRGAPTFRMNMYAGYHAHRPKMADDFIPQVKLVHKILEKMGVQMFGVDGYEADDLIGTIAKKTVDEFNEEVVIVTGDRDLLQLVNEHVKVLMPLNGFSKTILFDEAAVEEKYGVHPRQFIDYKALIGDASDGYPGVTGIGPKSAAKLLQKHGTFEKLYEDIGLLPEKVGLKLATDAEQAALAKQLATIVTDAPIQFDIKKCLCSDFDIAALRKAFQEQGFKSIMVKVDALFSKELLPIPVSEKEKDADQLELL